MSDAHASASPNDCIQKHCCHQVAICGSHAPGSDEKTNAKSTLPRAQGDRIHGILRLLHSEGNIRHPESLVHEYGPGFLGRSGELQTGKVPRRRGPPDQEGDVVPLRSRCVASPETRETSAVKLKLSIVAGKRVCAGETFARQNMFVIFAAILQNFTVTADTEIDFSKNRYGVALAPQPDLYVRFKQRT